MRRVLVKASIAGLTLCIGVVGSMLAMRLRAESGRNNYIQCSSKHVADHADKVLRNEPHYEPRLESLSPFAIETFINGNPTASLRDVWQKLGIDRKSSEGIPDLLNACTDCKAEIHEYELDNEPGKEVLLKVADNPQEACRYLVFKRVELQGGEGWKLLGHIDHDFGRYNLPQHFYFLSGGRNWLVIQVQAASGSGVSLYFDRVFAVERNSITEVLSYSSEGHQHGFESGLDRDFTTRITGYEKHKTNAALTVEFIVNYRINVMDRWKVISSKTQRAVYVQRPNSSKYRLDSAQSDLSRNEMESVYNIDSLSSEDFLKYNYQDLMNIARGRDQDTRDWLRLYLDECTNVPQKKSLRQALKNN